MSRGRDIARAATTVAATAVTVALTAGIAVNAAGAATEARDWFAFGFAAPSGSLSEAGQIAAHNITLAAAPYLAAFAIGAVPRIRPLTDALLALILVANSALIGAAFAAYGSELAPILVPHLPLELAGFSVAAGVYIAVRCAPVQVAAILVTAITAVALIAVAAAAEASALG